jgi:hypothetical protein
LKNQLGFRTPCPNKSLRILYLKKRAQKIGAIYSYYFFNYGLFSRGSTTRSQFEKASSSHSNKKKTSSGKTNRLLSFDTTLTP